MKNVYLYKYNNTTGAVTFNGIVDNYESLTFNRSYSGIGEWKMVISDLTNIDAIKGSDFIGLDTGVAGLISTVKLDVGAEANQITVTGVELKGLAQKRIIVPDTGLAYQSYTDKSPEYIMAQLIDKQIINATASRKIFGSIATYTETTTNIDYEGRFQNVAEEIVKLAEAYNIGWYADIVNGAIVWKIYQGKNRTSSQSTNSRFIISYDYDTMSGSTLENSKHTTNTALVAGQGEGTARATTTVNNTNTGLARTEVFVDARDIADSGQLSQRGQEKLAEYGSASTYACAASQTLTDTYRNAYDLGDVGSIIELGSAVDFRLTEVTEVYENSEFKLDMAFGYDAKTLTAALARIQAETESLKAVEQATILAVADGGTGSNTAVGARTNLGAAAASHTHTATDINSGILAVANGGTGQATLALARNAMGLGNTTAALPIANGGTGQTTAAAVRNALGLGNTTGALPIANGGTGATTAAGTVSNLGIQSGSIVMPTAAGGQNSATITFANPYATIPKIFFQLNYSGTSFTNIFLAPASLTSTNFVLRLYNGSSGSLGNQTIFWFAIGDLA